ncbi:MAG: DUF4912 domain-containing protein [Pseudomonadota bacterium]
MGVSDQEEPYYLLSPAELLFVAEETASYFPQSITGTVVALMEVDPYTTHVYWNIDQRALGLFKLRFFSFCLADDAEVMESFEKDMEGRAAGRLYINAHPQRRYVAQLGFYGEDGEFIVLARSNEVITPPCGPACFSQYPDKAVYTLSGCGLRIHQG